jgi:two-component system invasion response regulator UvrY
VKSAAAIGVFIAEDSELLQDLLVAALEEIEGVALCGQAMTGRQAIAGIRETQPDVLLLDLNMPGGGGIEVLEANNAAGGCDPLVIIMTFECDPLIRRRCRSLGAHIFFDKGDDPQALIDLLAKLATRKCTLTELKNSTLTVN